MSGGLSGRALGRVTAALVAVSWVVTSLVIPPMAQAADPSEVSIKKSVSPTSAVPGDEVLYTLEVSCSGLTTDCLSPVITDQLPPGLTPVSVPGSSSERTIDFDETTKLLTAEYVIPLSSPPNDPGATGLPAGATRKISISMRVPTDAQSGTITNSATFKGANTNEATSSVDLPITVPRVNRVVGTKAWSPSSAVAQSNSDSSILLGTRNASSISAEVTALSISDFDTDTFEHFDVTQLGPVTAYPAGADQVEILACRTTVPCVTPTSVGTFSGVGPFTPAGLNLADVTGVRFVYSNAGGAVLPPSTTNSGIELGVRLRDTFRSTGAVLEPPARIRVTNDASPALVDRVAGPTTGTAVSAVYDINPNTLVADTAKKFGPDDNLNYVESGKAYAGQGSGVFMEITGKDASGFDVKSLEVVEPDPSDPAAKAAFATVNASEFKVTPPTGTQTTTVTVECRTTGTQIREFTETTETTFTVASFCGPDDHPSSISTLFTGTTAGGAGAIVTGSPGTLRIVGRLNGTEAAGPLQNCAVTRLTNPVNSSGAGTDQGCATLTVLPSTLKPATTKNFFSDTNGDFTADGTAYAGQASGVAMTITGQNLSGFPVDAMVIAEPNPSSAANFAKVDVTKVRVTPPSGATEAELSVVCRGGATVTRVLNPPGQQTIDLGANPAACPGGFPSSVSVKYTGDIANNATGKLDLVGTLNDGAAAGSVVNCASTTLTNAGSPGPVTVDGCSTLTVASSAATSSTAKKFCGGTNPDCPAAGPPVVVGLNSPVAMGVAATNTSGFSVSTLTIVEPEPGNAGAKAAFDAVDATTVRVLIPAGATSTTVTATCRTGSSPTPQTITGQAGTEQTVAALCSGGGLPATVQVTFTGTIANNASGRLAILGTANSTATAALANCAQTTAARPGSTDGVSRACATLTPVPNLTTGTGTKTFVPDNNLDYTQDGDAVAGLGSGVSMTIRGANTSKFPVGSLTITEPDPSAAATFAKVDITKLRITPPTGTTKQTVTITCRSGATPVPTVFNNGATQNLTNPCGASFPATVAVRFEGSIAVNATGTLALAGHLNGAATAGTLKNCATVDIASPGSPGSSQIPCADLTVKANTLTAVGTKIFAPDNNLDFTQDGQAYEGQSSGVLLRVTGTNTSGFAVQRLIITEPDPENLSAEATLAQIDVEKVRLTPPTGTASTSVTATCRGGSSNTVSFTGSGAKTYTAAELCGATLPEAVRAIFSGVVPNGQGGTLAMVGRLKDTAQGTLPNCATLGVENTGSPNSPIVKPCASLIVQKPNIDFDQESKTSGGIGVIVPGQPLEFTLSFRNNSDIPVTNVVLDDPVGTNPLDPANPFDYVRLVEATTPAAPVNDIEVYDPQAGAYVPYDGADAGLLARVTGIRVRVTGTMSPGATFNALRYKVVLRDGVNSSQVPPITFQNCAAVGTPNPDPADRFCNETPISVVPGTIGGNTNKSFDPSNLDRPWPGQDPLTVPTTNVRLLVQNTGQLNLSTLVLTDIDADFWDAYDFVGNVRVNLPPGADRVQLDVCTSLALCAARTFVLGTATAATNPVPLPAGVDPAEVRGIRVSFLRADGAYLLTPSTALPAGNNCNGNNVCIQVRPRATTLSTGELVPAEVVNTAEAKGRSIRQGNDPNLPDYYFPIGNPPATITLTEGRAAMDLDKDPDSRIGPGETAPFTLVIENTGEAGIPALYLRDPLPAELEFQSGTYPGAPAGQPYLIEYDLPAGTPLPPTVEFTPTTETLPGVPPTVRTSQLNWRFPGWVLVPGGKVTITYNVGLTPGTAANVDVRNTAGITSGQQGFSFECTPDNADDGVVQPGGDFGTPSPVASRFCTSYANVRSLEGTAFSASKWSAGRDELGFRNTLTGTVTPTSSDACPRFVVDGTTYTRYPCVAQNYPGQGFTFLLRLTNTSNNAITSSIRIMDTLPVAGDRGVLLVNQARGTQWSTPPRLLTAPTELSGFGIGQARFTTDSTIAPATPLCFELSPGLPGQPDGTVPDPCAKATWGATFPDDRETITAVDGTLQFDGQNALLPGQSALVTARVDSPTSLDGQSLAPVAWNSYAHEEILFVTGSGEEVRLPPTEPIKAGIAVVFGNVQVTKSVPNPPAGVDLGTFPINYRCTTTTEQPDGSQGAPVEVAAGSLGVRANATVAVPGPLPAGARCAFWETDTNGGVGSNVGEDNAVSITVQPGTTIDGKQPPQDVTITNQYPVGSLELAKTLEGPGVGLPLLPEGAWGDGPFSANVSCSFGGQVLSGFPRDVLIKPGAPTTIDGLPIGATCEVVETATGAAVSTTTIVDGIPVPGPGATVPIPDSSTRVEFVNAFPTGDLRINKILTGDGAAYADRDFVFTVACVRDPLVFAPVTATITPVPGNPASLTTLVAGLPAGSICAVREVDDGGAGGENPPPGKLIATVVIAADQTAEAVVNAENNFPAGRVSIRKIVTGPGASAAAESTFTIDVTCQRTDRNGAPVEIFTETVTIRGGQTVPIDRPVPVGGSCWAVETDTGGATTVDIDHDSADNAIAVTEANAATGIGITATNFFGVGGLTITKSIEGAGAAFADQPFVFDVTCGLNGAQVYDQDVTITPPTLTASIIGLPTNAQCTVVERAPYGGADGPARLQPPGPYTIGQGGAVGVTATNTFSVGSVTVAKTVVNPDPGVDLTLIPEDVTLNFPILVTCQRPLVDGTYLDLPGFPRSEVLSVARADFPSAGESFTVDKPLGEDLPIGTRCWGEELDSQGATIGSVDFDSPDNAVTVALPQEGDNVPPITITATNTYEPGGLFLRKVIEGAGAGFAKQPFEFLVSCTVGNTQLEPFTLTIKPPKTTAGRGRLVAGAECSITETVTGGADGPAVIDPESVTIPAGEGLPVQVTATNTFSAGSLTVAKALAGPGAPFAADVEFTLKATCTWTVDNQPRTVLDQEFRLKGGQDKVFEPLPMGAECDVTEIDPGGATATEISGPVTITPEQAGVLITATNTFTVGAVRITKVIEPADYPYADRPFTFAAACTFAGTALPVRTVTIYPPENVGAISNLPTGAVCDVTETDTGGADSPATISPSRVTIGNGAQGGPVQVTATNTFSLGSLTLTKQVTGPAAEFVPDDTEFGLRVKCSRAGPNGLLPFVDELVKVTAGATVPLGVDLPIGAHCTVVEEQTMGATGVEVSPSEVTITLETPDVEVTATNAYDLGQMTLRKVIDPEGFEFADRPFTFLVRCTFLGSLIPDREVTIKPDTGKQVATIDGIPVGAQCSAKELPPFGGADGPAVMSPESVTIPRNDDPQVAEIIATNTFSVGSLSVSKVVDGPAAAEVAATRVFDLKVTCTREGPNGPVQFLTESASLRGGESASYGGLPIGAVCQVTEPNLQGATTTVITPKTVEITLKEPKVSVVVTNTYNVGDLRIRKAITGSGAQFATQPFAFAVTCTFQGAALATRTLTIAPPATTATVAGLPTGASCSVVETNTGGADGPAVVTPTTVTVGDTTTGEVTAVNTFSVARIDVAKVVLGKGKGPYTFLVSCTWTVSGRAVPVALPGGGVLTLDAGDKAGFDVPAPSTCTVTETDVSSDAEVTISETGEVGSGSTTDGIVALGSIGDRALVEVTNTFPPLGPTTVEQTDKTTGGAGRIASTGASLGYLPVGLLAIFLGGLLVWGSRRRQR